MKDHGEYLVKENSMDRREQHRGVQVLSRSTGKSIDKKRQDDSSF